MYQTELVKTPVNYTRARTNSRTAFSPQTIKNQKLATNNASESYSYLPTTYICPGFLIVSIEGAIAQRVRICGLYQTRYHSLAKTYLQHIAMAAAFNFDCIARWFDDRPRAKIHQSRFAALNNALPLSTLIIAEIRKNTQ